MSRLQEFLAAEIAGLKEQNLFTTLPTLDTPQGNRVRINGKDCVMFCSNNYLGFASHPRLATAAKKAIDRWGYGCGAVRQIAGSMRIHHEFEEALAAYKHAPAALMFVAGIAANRGTIQALMGEGDVVISDELNHGSIIDGVRLTKAERKIYPHLDMAGLEKALQESKESKKKLVVTDGVFSMDGDIAPLDQIVELAEKHDAFVMVDDAHGDGVLGTAGRGIVDHFKLQGRVAIDMGTFSKAFGCVGGYIAGSQDLKEFLVNRARSFIFTTGPSPENIAACWEALKIVQEEPQHMENLWKNTTFFKKEMASLGFDIGRSKTPITPVMVGESARAQQLSSELFQEGIFAKPIVYPLVAKDKARVRNIVNANHTKEDLDRVLRAYEKVGKKMGII